ncbi:MAG: hypothetical protein JW869_04300 [Candidatus Omnitrophica bacterium]|nr:hypothetical protein [Candidatus Omnitrophota bacterium]
MIGIFSLSAFAFAEIKDFGFTNIHTARIAASDNDDSLYLSRAAFTIDYELTPIERTFNILPFFEYQHNIDSEDWWRREAGAEIGTSFFNDIFYYGASFQHVWQQEENYPVELLEETTEWESRFVITPPLNWWLFEDVLTLHLFDEYTYDFTRGQATFNTCGATIDWNINDWLTVPFGWKHIDRVHDFDADTFEFSLQLNF